MTLTTFREVLVHGFRMRFAMTGATSRYHFMLLLMTGGTGNLGMLGRVSLKLRQDIVMTAGAAC